MTKTNPILPFVSEPFSKYLKVKNHVSPSLFKHVSCPEEMYYQMTHDQKETKEMVFGRLFHSLMEDGKETLKNNFVIIKKEDLPYPSNSTTFKANREFIAEVSQAARFEGKEFIRATAEADKVLFDNSVYMSNKLVKECYLKHYNEQGELILTEPFEDLLNTGLFEQSFYTKDPITGVKIKFRPDWFTQKNNRHIIFDFKTTISAEFESFYRNAVKLGYDQAAAFYIDFYKIAMGLSPDTPVNFFFPVIQKTPPYLTNLFRCTEEFLEAGRQKYRKRLNVLTECLKTGKFVGLRINHPMDKGYQDLIYPTYDYQLNKNW